MSTIPHQIGPYRIQTEIGRGGMAVVYRALDTRSGTVVALKVLPPHLAHDERYLQRFEREGKSAARLRHPNIVRTLETGASDGYHYLAMQYVEGQTLAEMLRTQRSLLPPARVVELVQQVAEALDYAHNLGVLHRDIKSSNIMLDREGHALLMDFGVAKLVDEDHTAYTVVGTTVGTPAFMAPEQARGSDVDRRADIYSLGVIAYSLFTGAMPFKADSQPALLHKIVYDPPIQPEEVNRSLPSGVVYALKKVLAKSPSQRYASAGEFAIALGKGLTWAPSSGELRAVQERMLVTGGSQEQVAAAPRSRRRSSGGAMLIGASTLAAVATALFLFVNPLPWMSGAPAASEDRAEAAAPATITLLRFQPDESTYRLEVPANWTEGSSIYASRTVHTFDAPDRIGRVFSVQLDVTPESDTIGSAPETLRAFLATGDLPYTKLRPAGAVTDVSDGSHPAYEQEASALWLGRPVAVYVRVIEGSGAQYLVGMIVEAGQSAVFEPLRQAVFDSVQVDLPSLAQAATDTPPADPTNENGPKNDADSPGVVELPGSTSTPLVEAVATEGGLVATETADSLPSISLPTPTDVPPSPQTQPTLTPDPTTASGEELTPTDSAPPAAPDVPTATPTPKTTATALPTNTATNTPTQDLGATQTAEATRIAPLLRAVNTATATRTNTPALTATRTPTRTPTPNAAATQTAAMEILNTSVAQTLTALAPRETETGTPTPRATATPLPTATRTPSATVTSTSTASPTATQTPNLGATQTAETQKLGTALAQTMTAIAPPTATKTATPTHTPRPTATTVPTATPVFRPTATPTQGGPDLAVLEATAEAIQTALAELSATPSPTVSELDATATAINEMLTAIAPKAP